MGIRWSRPNTSATPQPSLKQLRQVLRAKVLSISTSKMCIRDSIAGVDTHKDVHVLCLLDGLGRKVWSGSFGADPEAVSYTHLDVYKRQAYD